MKTIFAVLCLLLVCTGCTTTHDGRLVIEQATLIDPESGRLHEGQTILIEGDRIRWVGPSQAARKGRARRVIDARGKFVIPGLWDMHGHFEFAGFDPAVPLLVANGVTGVRDMGGDPDALTAMRERIRSGALPHVRVFIAGKMLDGVTPNWPLRITVTDAEAAKTAVDAQRTRGADFIKVHGQLTREAYFAIAERAKIDNIPFAGHVTRHVTGIEAANAGQVSLEHLTGTPWCKDASCESAAEAIRVYKQHVTFQVPTLSVYHANVQTFRGERLRPDLAAYLPPVMRVWWQFQDTVNEPYLPPPAERLADAQQALEGATQLLGAMYRGDVPIMAGTDFGYTGVLPGFGLHTELELLVAAGLSPLDALRTATIQPARFFRLENDLGTITAGKYADLVVLNRNPLERIGAVRDIHAVVSNGVLYEHAQLAQLLDPAHRPASR